MVMWLDLLYALAAPCVWSILAAAPATSVSLSASTHQLILIFTLVWYDAYYYFCLSSRTSLPQLIDSFLQVQMW